MQVNSKLGKELLVIVRKTVLAAFAHKNYQLEPAARKRLSQELGVFVNIYLNKDLRGSFGYPPGVYPLADGIKRAARGAAFGDPRFQALSKSDFARAKFEVALIKEFKELKVKPNQYFKKINPKKHGIFIKYGPFNSMQLPQFAVKRGFSARDYLEKTIEKAGLAPELWQSPRLKVSIFDVVSFSE